MDNIFWSRLMEFESHDLIKRYIEINYSRDASARQIAEISSNFIQGREYFNNAKNADITVKPLLLYYGVLALSRGLILCKQPRLSMAALKPSHGIETLDWQQSLSDSNFADLKVRFSSGCFMDFLVATDNKSYFRSNSSSANCNVNFTIPDIGTIITLERLLATFSDLSEQFSKWRTKEIDYLILNSLINTVDQKYEYGFNMSSDKKLIARLFPDQLYPDLIVEEKFGQLTVIANPERAAQLTQRFSDPFHLGIGVIAITNRPCEECCLSTLGQFYCLSYYFGMLARYYPGTWVSLGRGIKGDAIFPLVRQAVSLIEKCFPRLICEFLEGPYSFEKPQ